MLGDIKTVKVDIILIFDKNDSFCFALCLRVRGRTMHVYYRLVSVPNINVLGLSDAETVDLNAYLTAIN
jgi:hypothetical protein